MNSELILLYSLVAMIWLENTFLLYLVLRQRNVMKTTTTVPHDLEGIITQETFSEARLYNLERITFGIVNSIFETVLGITVVLLYIIPLFWKYSANIAEKFGYQDSEIIVSIVFMVIANTLTMLIGLPFQIYSVFVIEERYGFNKQTPMFFLKDNIKSYILMQMLTAILIAPTVYIIRAGGQYFFIYLWLFTVFFTLFFFTVYPELIAPLFDKYTPLEEGELRTSIENLTSSIDFPLTKLYVVEGSKRSAHSNAYFYGFFKNKRIVLFDTLLKDRPSTDKKDDDPKPEESGQTDTSPATPSNKKKGLSNEEILAVLAHELGHWKGNHVLKTLIITQINFFLLFMAFSYLFRYDIFYRAFGFYNAQPVIIGLYIIFQYVFNPYNFIISFLMTLLTRKHEFEADAFAVSLGKAQHLRSSLIKLNQDNLGFPVNDWLYSTFTHSHPPLLERLKALNKSE